MPGMDTGPYAGPYPRGRAVGRTRGRTEDVAAGEPTPPRRRANSQAPASAPPGSRPSIARRAHRAVPVGRSTIARRGRPPSCGPRRPCWSRSLLVVDRAGGRELATRRPASSGSCTRSARSNRAAATRPGTPRSGAYGKYQIMPASWAAWAKHYLGSSTAPQTPANQETVAHRKVTALYNWLDSWPTRRPLVADRVLRAELRASGRRSRGPTSQRIMTIMGATTRRRRGAARSSSDAWITPDDRRVGETVQARSPTLRVVDRPLRAYSGHQVKYATRTGASASIDVHRQRDRLDRSGRPDPGHGPGLHRRKGGRRPSTSAGRRSTPASSCFRKALPAERTRSRSSSRAAAARSRSTS